MSNFLICIKAVAPLAIMMAVGYIARCLNIIKRDDVPMINKIIFRVFMPVMMFDSLYNSDFTDVFNIKLVVYVLSCVLVSYIVVTIYAKKTTPDSRRCGVIIQGAFRSNFVIMGFPVVAAISDGNLGMVALLLATVVPLFNILSVICLEKYTGSRKGNILKGILTNPIIVGTFFGVLFVVLKIKLPDTAVSIVSSMSSVASPMSLFLLGAFFDFDSIKENFRDIARVSVLRLLLIPGIVMTISVLIGIRGINLAAILAIFGSSTAVNSFTMAQQMGGDDVLAGGIVVTTSALCPITMFVWCLIFKSLGLF